MRLTLKFFTVFLLLWMTGSCISAKAQENTTDTLFPVRNGHLVGYMNTEGTWIIPPRFHVGGEFSEGLAFVRETDQYGYINTKGEFIIPAEYDRVFSFVHGMARVKKNGRYYYISKGNKRIFPDSDYRNMRYYPSGQYFIVQENNGGYHLVDRQNRVLTDTVYGAVFYLDTDLYEVREHKMYAKRFGVISGTGETVIPLGKNNGVSSAGEGWILADSKTGDDVLINSKDTSIRFPLEQGMRLKGNFSGGRVVIGKYNSEKPLVRVLDNSGKLHILEHVNWISEFIDGKAFIEDTAGAYYLINKNFKRIAGPFDYLSSKHRQVFQNGLTLVRDLEGWKILDTSGFASPVLLPPGVSFAGHYENYIQMILNGKYLYYSLKERDFRPLDYFTTHRPFQYCNDLVYYKLTDDNQKPSEVGLINKKGDTIFRQKLPPPAAKLNTTSRWLSYHKFLSSGDLDVGSPYYREEKGIFLDVSYRNDKQAAQDSAEIVVAIINSTNVPLKVRSAYPYLSILIKNTFDPNSPGWVNIQRVDTNPRKHINDRHEYPPGTYSLYTMPVFDGTIETSMIIRLEYLDRSGEKKYIYSKEIPCSANPGQLEPRSGYHYDHPRGHVFREYD